MVDHGIKGALNNDFSDSDQVHAYGFAYRCNSA